MNEQISLTVSRPRLRWVAILAIGLSLFLSALDTTIVALALPEIANHFQISNSSVASIVLAYTIPLTLLVLPAGTLIGRSRPRTLFTGSILGFGLASLACGFATNILFLLTARIIQGSFAALIATHGFALAAVTVEPRERGRAMGIIATIAPLGGIIGPGIGGILLAAFGWSSIFYVNLPIVLVAAVLGFSSLRDTAMQRQTTRLAYKQIITLLRNPRFFSALAGFFFSVSASVALYYFLPFDLTGIHHTNLTLSGLLLLSIPLGMLSMGLIGGYLTDRYQARSIVPIGSGLILVGSIALSLVVLTPTSELDLAWRLLLIGIGIGLFTSPTTTFAMSVGGHEMAATASALTNLAARLTTVIGPLVVSLAWSVFPTLSGQIIIGTLLVNVFAAVTFLFALFARRTSRVGY